VTLRAGVLGWDPTAERLISFVRLALAGGALLVVWIDPTQPSHYVPVAYTAFGLYVFYSAAVFRLVRRGPSRWLPIVTQVVDLFWVPPVLYFTEGANTPFFVFFVIFAFTAGIRWGLWASWGVTLYSLAVYTALLFLATPTPVDLNNDLMRIGYLLIVGVLGGYLAEYRRRREAELNTLRAISAGLAAKPSAVSAVAGIVEMARGHALADSVVGVLREPEGGEFLLFRGGADMRRLGPEEAATFLRAVGAGGVNDRPRGKSLSDADAVILRFAEAEAALGYPIQMGEELVGGIYFFYRSRRAGHGDSTDFSRLLLSHVIPQIETLYLLERARETRVVEERRRIARDLHDSFIQVLAALGFRLRALSASIGADEPAAGKLAKELEEMREIVGQELGRVRAYIAEMREPMGETRDLRELIVKTAEIFRGRTRIPLDISVAPDVARVPIEVARELAPLLREALTNVEKHARASRVSVSLDVEDHRLVLVVSDDGVGIGQERVGSGSGQLPTGGQGLRSMRERAELLGGILEVRPGEPRGTRLAVSIPLPALR
jgi:signal transduction histidine kinase